MTRPLAWLVVLLALLSTHCDWFAGNPDSEPAPGSGKLALQTADAAYRLVGTLNLERLSGDQPTLSVPLDGQADVVNFTLAAGAYQATLADNLSLVRLSTGTDVTELVTAVEVSPMPVVVTSGETTHVTIAITLTDNAIVVFGPGAVQIAVEVEEGTPECGACTANETCLALSDGTHRCVSPCSPEPDAFFVCADERECRLSYFTRNGDTLEPLYVCSDPVPGDPTGGTGGTGGTAGTGGTGGTSGSGGSGETSAGAGGEAPDPEPTADTVAATPILLPEMSARRRGPENSAIPLEIHAELTDTDGSETLTVLLEPDNGYEIQGAVLSDGTRSFTFSAGTASVDVSDWDLAAITVRQLANSDADLAFNVKARSTESNGGATTEVAIRIEVLVITEGNNPESTARTFDLAATGAALRLDGPSAGQDSFSYGFGRVVNGGGDFNGDGLSDIVVGSRGGPTFVVFGSANGPPSPLDVDLLDGSLGFRLDGWAPGGAAGDLDGDGFDDLVVIDTDSFDKNLAVHYGHAPPFSPVVVADSDLAVLRNMPYVIHSATTADVNGDGFDDVLVATFYGVAVLYGGASRFSDSISLFRDDDASFGLDGSVGSAFVGRALIANNGGYAVSSAGDVNGDGFEDLIIGDAPEGVPGSAYVVFGRPDGFGAATVDLQTLDGADGFKLEATTHAGGLGVGTAVSTAGDFNGDGFDDVVVGASSSTARDDVRAGATYVVFGHAGSFPAMIDLSALNGTDGFRADGAEAFDQFGEVVSPAGDVNADGFDDVLATAGFAALLGYREPYNFVGSSYVLYGRPSEPSPVRNLASLTGEEGTLIEGGHFGQTLSAGGDINGDGIADFLLGTPNIGRPDSAVFRSTAYVIFGGTLAGSGGPRSSGSGTPDADVLAGAAGVDDFLLGYNGNDRLDGNDGEDLLLAGPGNDVLVYHFGARLCGGSGFDTLEILSDLSLTGLHISQMRAITGIEAFDLRNDVVNEFTLDQRTFLHVVRDATAVASAPGLVIRGDEQDIVHAGSGWTLNGTAALDGALFNVYSPGGRTPLLWIEQSIQNVEILP